MNSILSSVWLETRARLNVPDLNCKACKDADALTHKVKKPCVQLGFLNSGMCDPELSGGVVGLGEQIFIKEHTIVRMIRSGAGEPVAVR